jgi:hypothetical protein
VGEGEVEKRVMEEDNKLNNFINSGGEH